MRMTRQPAPKAPVRVSGDRNALADTMIVDMSISRFTRRSVVAAMVAALAGTMAAAPAHADQQTTYTYVDLGSEPGYASSIANDANAARIVVGSSDNGVVWQDGEIGGLPMVTAWASTMPAASSAAPTAAPRTSPRTPWCTGAAN